MSKIKFPNTIANEYRLVGLGCITLSNYCISVGTNNITGGYSFAITGYNPATRELTLEPGVDMGKFAVNYRIFIATDIADENSPHSGKIVEVDVDNKKLTLESDLVMTGGEISLDNPALGAVKDMSREASAYASGDFNFSTGEYATSEGTLNVSSGLGSRAGGVLTVASGDMSSTEGYKTSANAKASRAQGHHTVAASAFQEAAGEYNLVDEGGSVLDRGWWVKVWGNGSEAAASNAAALNWNGALISSANAAPVDAEMWNSSWSLFDDAGTLKVKRKAGDGNVTVGAVSAVTEGAMIFKGAIATAADFPTAAEVKNGWMYRITADVIDNDPAKTNTGEEFKAEDEIAWNGASWTKLGSAIPEPAPLFIDGSFVDGNLTDGILTIVHAQGDVQLPGVITDNTGALVVPDDIIYTNNQITVNLSSFDTLSGTWHYAFGGGVEGKITENQSFTVGTGGKPTMYISSITGTGSTVTATLKDGESSTGWNVGDVFVLKGTVNHDGEYTVSAFDSTTVSWLNTETASENALGNAVIYYKQDATDITMLNNQLATLAGRDFCGYDLTINIQQGYYDIATAIALLDIKNGGSVKIVCVGDIGTTVVRNNRLYINTIADSAIYIRNASCANLQVYNMTLETTAARTNMWYDLGTLTIRECNIALMTVRFPSVIATSNNSCINVRANVIGEGRIESVYYEGGRQGIIGQDVVVASCSYGDPSTYPLYGVHAYYGILFVDLTLQGSTATRTITKGTIIDNAGHIAI